MVSHTPMICKNTRKITAVSNISGRKFVRIFVYMNICAYMLVVIRWSCGHYISVIRNAIMQQIGFVFKRWFPIRISYPRTGKRYHCNVVFKFKCSISFYETIEEHGGACRQILSYDVQRWKWRVNLVNNVQGARADLSVIFSWELKSGLTWGHCCFHVWFCAATFSNREELLDTGRVRQVSAHCRVSSFVSQYVELSSIGGLKDISGWEASLVH